MFRFTSIGTAGDVLFMPQQEVERSLLADDFQHTVARIIDRAGMPACDEVAMQIRDDLQIEHGRVRSKMRDEGASIEHLSIYSNYAAWEKVTRAIGVKRRLTVPAGHFRAAI
jgi:hypothetical protein